MQSTALPIQPGHNPPGHDERVRVSVPSEERQQTGMLVACFVLPAEHVEKLASILQDIAGSRLSDAPLNPPQPGTTTVTQSSSWLTHIEAAAYLGVAVSTLYRYAEQQRIECRKIGNRLEYRRTSLDRFKDQQIRPARRPQGRGIIATTLGSGN